MLLGVDVGGTFTDAALIDGGTVHTAKVPSTPGGESAGVMAAIEAVLARAGAASANVESFAHGMTVGTNALLEERGARTALIATRGFADLLEIGRQNRPHLYRLCAPKPAPLIEAELRFEAAERIGPEGVVEPLDEDEPERLAQLLRDSGAESVAICLLFSYLDPAHEQRLAAHLREALPDLHVSASHEVLPRFREYERCSTTAIDAYLSPLLGRYLRQLDRETTAAGLPRPLVMQSSGGVAAAEEAARAGAWSVLSGPAGGAVGAGLLARVSGDGNALGFDMGGTSCDVCVVEDGEVRRTDSRQIDGRTIQLPMVDVHTVGAGGGSIGWRDAGGALRVGPRSAGAEPGPACYGHGGEEPTVTDANLVLGNLAADSRLAGGVALDAEAAEVAIGALAERLGLDPLATAAGIVRVANQEMVRALRVVTVERGVDPRGFALLPFGGAGPMHAAAIAAELGIETILCPRASGVLSALGLCASRAPPRHRPHGDARRQRAQRRAHRRRGGADDRLARSEIWTRREPEVIYEMRYAGQAFELPIPGPVAPDPADLRRRFEPHTRSATATATPRARSSSSTSAWRWSRPGREPRPSPRAEGRLEEGSRRVRFGERVDRDPGPARRAGGRYQRRRPGRLRAARGDPGPAAGLERRGRRRRHDRRAVRKSPYGRKRNRGMSGLDPIALQVLIGGLRAACDEMGATLIRSAYSANIKERHDCSTALFDAAGELVMQAEHIPVHLGSMPDAVAAVLGEEQRPGGRLDPQRPLPRRHPPARRHPDLAGLRRRRAARLRRQPRPPRRHRRPDPGRDAGLLADARGRGRGDPADPRRARRSCERLAGAMRSPRQRLADLRAQQAANRVGELRLAELAERLGAGRLRAGMAEILAYAERRTRAALAALPDGTYRAEDVLEDDRGGSRRDVALRVEATIEGDRLRLDFTGTDAQVDGNLNCPLSVTKSAAFFAVRVADRPRRPALRRRPPPDRGPRPARLPAQRPLPGRGRRRQRRDLEPRRRPRDRRPRRRPPGSRPGPGDDEQPDPGQRGLHLLRDARRRPGRLPGRPTAPARSTWRCRTPSTPRSRRWRPSSRCGCASSRCAAAAAARATHRGGDGIVREIEALAPMRFTLISERRRHPPRGRGGGEDGAAGPQPARRRAAGEQGRGRADSPETALESRLRGGAGAVFKRSINLAIRTRSSRMRDLGQAARPYDGLETQPGPPDSSRLHLLRGTDSTCQSLSRNGQ